MSSERAWFEGHRGVRLKWAFPALLALFALGLVTAALFANVNRNGDWAKYRQFTQSGTPSNSVTVALPNLIKPLSPEEAIKENLARLDTLDPTAQDARRLMSIHLPGLIERYERVPVAYRQERDGEGKTVDQRLVEGLAAGRSALAEVSEQLARADVAALETQGRFIEARYGAQRIDSEETPSS